MNVLLTGAAGLLGGAVAASLMQAGHTVFGLVHRATQICGNDGKSLAALPFEGSEPLAGTLTLLHGDVRHDDLGLGQTTLQWLSRRIDVVVHCAALVKFEADLAALAAVNVDGTCTVARLFSHARFIHVSTAYVCGLKNGPIAEQPCDTRGEFGNAYEQSKAQSEAALLQLRPDATIARPSIIIGEAASGRIQKFDTIYRAFKFIAEGRIRAVTVTPSATLNFVPIDHVVAGLCDLVDRATARGRIVHLAARQAVPAAYFLGLIARIPGLCSPAIACPGGDDPDRRLGIAERLAQPYWSYFQRSPAFETTALAQISGRPAPLLDDAAFIRHIGYCVEAGFIRPD